MTRVPELVRYETEAGVATISLNRPERLNAVDLATGRAYNAALLRADGDAGVRAIVVTGVGRAFCAGADLSAMTTSAQLTPDERLPDDGLAPDLAFRLRKPVIAAVHGPAIGVGLVLALFADIRIVAADAPLSFNFTRLGLVAEYATAWLLPRLIGAGPATDLLLTSRRFTGREAADLGLAHQALPAEQVKDVAQARAAELAAYCSPAALAATKEQLRAAASTGLDEALALSRNWMRTTLDSPDVVEGFTAQAQHRTPRFPPLPEGGP